MPRWFVGLGERAKNDFNKLDRPIQKDVLKRLEWLRENFDYLAPLSLGNEWKGFFKLRVRDWRVVYQIDDKNLRIVVRYIDRRDKIYKRRK